MYLLTRLSRMNETFWVKLTGVEAKDGLLRCFHPKGGVTRVSGTDMDGPKCEWVSRHKMTKVPRGVVGCLPRTHFRFSGGRRF